MKKEFKVLAGVLLSVAIMGTSVHSVCAKTSTVTEVIGSNVYYYGATTGTEVLAQKDFNGWRGPHRKGNKDLQFTFTVSYSQSYTKSGNLSSTLGWSEGAVVTVSSNVGVAKTEVITVTGGTAISVEKSAPSGVYQMAQFVPQLYTTYTTKYSNLSGKNMKTKNTLKLAMPRVDCSYPDYYKKLDLPK